MPYREALGLRGNEALGASCSAAEYLGCAVINMEIIHYLSGFFELSDMDFVEALRMHIVTPQCLEGFFEAL